MKRLAFLFAATMLAATAPQPADAQHTVVRNRTRVTITNPEGERVVVRSDDDNRITLRVASVEIGLDDEGNVRTSAAPLPGERRSHSATPTSNPSSSWASTPCPAPTIRCTVRCPTNSTTSWT